MVEYEIPANLLQSQQVSASFMKMMQKGTLTNIKSLFTCLPVCACYPDAAAFCFLRLLRH